MTFRSLSALAALFIGVVTAGLASADPGAVRPAKPALAIVIDDIGYDLAEGQRLVDLPVPLTLAILPYTPNARRLAESARAAGKEVILHQPMQALTNGNPSGDGRDDRRRQPGDESRDESLSGNRQARGTLTLGMNRTRFIQTLRQSLDAVPYSAGINNHTGSLLTQQPRQMNWLMGYLSARGLYFLDSRTTAATVAYAAAREWSVPVLKRDVFLDNDPSRAAVKAALERSIHIAHRQGYAVVIGHPNPETVAVLTSTLPTLQSVELTTAGALAERVSRYPEVLAQR